MFARGPKGFGCQYHRDGSDGLGTVPSASGQFRQVSVRGRRPKDASPAVQDRLAAFHFGEGLKEERLTGPRTGGARTPL
jgi:hypothetical protein